MKLIEYSSNNSGGSWWLSLEDWKALDKAGWVVDWKAKEWLGTMATRATRLGLSLEDAIKEFEKVTDQDVNDMGCECCGPPHNFYEEDVE